METFDTLDDDKMIVRVSILICLRVVNLPTLYPLGVNYVKWPFVFHFLWWTTTKIPSWMRSTKAFGKPKMKSGVQQLLPLARPLQRDGRKEFSSMDILEEGESYYVSFFIDGAELATSVLEEEQHMRWILFLSWKYPPTHSICVCDKFGRSRFQERVDATKIKVKVPADCNGGTLEIPLIAHRRERRCYVSLLQIDVLRSQEPLFQGNR